MEEACKGAREKTGKMDIYNKKKHYKKVRAVVRGSFQVIGNKRLWKVMGKKEDILVCKINKNSDVRLVHRNLLMLCNDLPLVKM